MADCSTRTPGKALASLPGELITEIATHLLVEDLKNLRICSRQLEVLTFDIFYFKATFAVPLSLSGLQDLAKLADSDVRFAIESVIFRDAPDESQPIESDQQSHKLVSLTDIVLLLARMPRISSLSLVDSGMNWYPQTSERILNEPSFSKITSLTLDVSRTDYTGDLCTFLAKCPSLKRLTVRTKDPRYYTETANAMTSFMWSFGKFLQEEGPLSNLESLVLHSGRMHLSYLCSVLASLRATLRTVEIIDIAFAFVEPATMSQLFDEVEANDVLKSIKFRHNGRDLSGHTSNVFTRALFRDWDEIRVAGFKRWLENGSGPRAIQRVAWAEIRPEREVSSAEDPPFAVTNASQILWRLGKGVWGREIHN